MNIRELELWAHDRADEHIVAHFDDAVLEWPEVVVVVPDVPRNAVAMFVPVSEGNLRLGNPGEVAEQFEKE